jgi:AraC-like DNA-binding protein
MLLVALPVTCYLVGGLLILVTLVAVGLFLLKSREVASLKKEVEDLRDTMRMMRYEEASLSRMLHTVDKSSVSPSMSEQAETPGTEDNLGALVAMESQELEVVDLPAEESVGESTEELIDSILQESVEESQTMMVVEEPVEEDVLIEIEEEYSITDELVQAKEKSSSSDGPAGPIATKVEVESEAKPEEETAVETQMEQLKVEPAARKQAINERRPAIPHDLFSAWFAENEDIEAEKKQMETDAPTTPADTEVSPKTSVVAPQESSIDEIPHHEPIESAHPSETAASQQIATEDVADEDGGEEGKAPMAQSAIVKLSKEDERFCRKLERIVHTRMRNPDLNIDVIASQFGMGRTNFYRKVRELMGMSPNDYLRKCRMERAALLIKDTNMPIAEICAQVGVPDAQYFSRVFKTFYGVPPSTYREQL